jgi:hypothetical protein
VDTVPLVIEPNAAELASERVRSVRRSPDERVALAAGFYDRAGRRGYERAELSFLRWEIARGVLHDDEAEPAGSPWWRAVNDRLLRDKTEAGLLHNGQRGRASSVNVEHWLGFLRGPSPAAWWRAHNASIVSAYLDHEDLARLELEAERFMMNVALARVLLTHAMVARPSLAIGRLAPLGPRLADPRRATVALFVDLRRSYPEEYPLTDVTVEQLVAREGRIARAIDERVISPRLADLYAFSAALLDEPRITEFVRAGIPRYARNGVPLSGT